MVNHSEGMLLTRAKQPEGSTTDEYSCQGVLVGM